MSRTGLTERAIRRILRQLIDLQLLAPKDSPNGKRYAVKDLGGQVVDAFGFDLTPVYARRGDWAVMLLEQKQLREVQKRARIAAQQPRGLIIARVSTITLLASSGRT